MDVIDTAQSVAQRDTLCTACGGTMHPVWVSNGYPYFACSCCKLVRVSPTPDATLLKDYYAKVYAVDRTGYERNVRKQGRRIIDVLERFDRPGRMLEVGCSWGQFLNLARQRGWHVKGIEPSPDAACCARQQLGLDVECATLEEFSTKKETPFDAVVAWHVIEHAPDPAKFLRMVRDLLRPGGVFAVRTPNIQSLPARINGVAWHWVGGPEHLWLFSQESLRLSLEECGFRVVYSRTRRGDAHNPLFEIARGGSIRLGLHARFKRLLNVGQPEHVASAASTNSQQDSCRAALLRRLNRTLDFLFCPLYPVEKLIDLAGGGPELFMIAVRNP